MAPTTMALMMPPIPKECPFRRLSGSSGSMTLILDAKSVRGCTRVETTVAGAPRDCAP